MMRRMAFVGSILLGFSGVCAAQPGGEPLDWQTLEPPVLTDHVQLTSRDMFVKAGEAYFSPDGEWIIFQAVPTPDDGESADEHYSMYVAQIAHDDRGSITGIEEPIRISPIGSANTCGWFHPKEHGVVMFGSTIVRPGPMEAPGYQRQGGRYKWAFPSEMEVVSVRVPEMDGETVRGDRAVPKPIFERPGYDAEGSWSPDGRFILYANVDEAKSGLIGRPEADIWIYDTQTHKHHALVTAPGYDGGPFFSPDGKSILYRSDRRGDDLLQVFVAELAFDADGVPSALKSERALTANQHVNWAPFWHPSGDFVIYGTSQMGHFNYEVFAVETDKGKTTGELRAVRITKSNGADVLPVFSPDGAYMMWTGQRGPLAESDTRPTSQLWIAKFDASNLFAQDADRAVR
jgi:TolB protein